MLFYIDIFFRTVYTTFVLFFLFIAFKSKSQQVR